MSDDWWNTLYDPLPGDTGSTRPAKAAPQARHLRGGGRLPDWRTGQHINLDKDAGEDTSTEAAEPDAEPGDVESGTDDAAPQASDGTDDTDTAPDEPDVPARRGYLDGLRRAADHPGRRPAYRDTPPPSPRHALADTWHRTPTRLRWLTYHAAAAFAGWTLGAVDFATHVTAWIATNGMTTGQAWFWYAAAAACTWLYHWSRDRWLIVAWPCAIPLTSAVTGALLYTPGA